MWFWLSLIALLCWSGSDLFSKIGCQSETDKYSHLKMVTAVGVVMGLHAAYEIFIGGTQVTWEIIWTYLPVSLLYISSMAMGYIGLRYIELSISSPICNSSGALVAVLCLITGGMGELVPAQLVATALVCVGVVGLGIVEAHEDEDLRRKRQEAANRRYAKSALALLLPSAAPLIGMLMFGNLLRVSGVTERLSKTAQNELMNIVTIFLGISVGATASAANFLRPQTLLIIALGLVAFSISTCGGLLTAKLMNVICGGTINPLIGSAGVSAVPMAARVSQLEGQKYDPTNFLLMHAMGPNVAGVIGSAVAAGVFLAWV